MIVKGTQRNLGFRVFLYKILPIVVITPIPVIGAKLTLSQYYGPTLVIASIFVLLALIYTAIYYYLFTYIISTDSIEITSGVLFRTSKRINFNDLKSAEVRQDPLLMVFGLGRFVAFTSTSKEFETLSKDSREISLEPYFSMLLPYDDARDLSELSHMGDIQRVEYTPI